MNCPSSVRLNEVLLFSSSLDLLTANNNSTGHRIGECIRSTSFCPELAIVHSWFSGGSTAEEPRTSRYRSPSQVLSAISSYMLYNTTHTVVACYCHFFRATTTHLDQLAVLRRGFFLASCNKNSHRMCPAGSIPRASGRRRGSGQGR